MKKYNSIILLLLVVLLGGCTAEKIGQQDKTLPEGSVKIMFINSNNPSMTRADTNPDNINPSSENYVRKIQVFFYNSTSKQLECVREYTKEGTNNGITWDGTSSSMIVHRISNVSIAKDIYVVTNWMVDLPQSISVSSNVSELTKQITALEAPLPGAPSHEAPLLMSCKVEGHIFHTSDKVVNPATITLKRQAVKINVKVLFNQDFLTSVVDKFNFTDNVKLQTFNLPNNSYVIEQTPFALPTKTTMFDSPDIVMTKESTQWSHILYSYENPQIGILPADKLKSTYFNLNYVPS